MEIERKFLIDRYPDLPEQQRIQMLQGYLATGPAVRVRSEQPQDKEGNPLGNTRYILCIKGKGQLVREEIELEIENAIFQRLCALLDAPLICKELRTYRLPDGHLLECSLVDRGLPCSFMYAEVEFSSREEALAFQPPDCLGRELTEEPSASMSAYWQRRKEYLPT
ncbi:MAG: hypothetical protein HFG26_07315 [Provencibacterium sp.]|jgi:adenylate cyclase|nr:hypothetical protein [Provencibacterium sp.]